MALVMGKFCPVCGQSRPALVSKRIHLTKNQRYRCEGCASEFTIHVDETEDQATMLIKKIVDKVT